MIHSSGSYIMPGNNDHYSWRKIEAGRAQRYYEALEDLDKFLETMGLEVYLDGMFPNSYGPRLPRSTGTGRSISGEFYSTSEIMVKIVEAMAGIDKSESFKEKAALFKLFWGGSSQ
jgi:hypothetical protein